MKQKTQSGLKESLLIGICCLYSLLLGISFASAASKEILRHRIRADNSSLRQAKKAANKAALFGLDAHNKISIIHEIKNNRTGKVYSRYRQYFRGIPIWGEQIIITSKNRIARKIRGKVIKGIIQDLKDIRSAFSPADALILMKEKNKEGLLNINDLKYQNEKSQLVVFVDDSGQARLAYFVSFFADIEAGGHPTRPHYIIDAKTGDILKHWEGLTHAEVGTGPGGNLKSGQYEYGTDFGFLDVATSGSVCTMNNLKVKTVDLNHGTSGSTAYSYGCYRNTHKFRSLDLPILH